MTTTATQPNKWFLPQWKLMREATRDTRLNAVDHAVLMEILDRHLDDFGNSRASWTHLVRTTGRARSAVAESAGKLVAQGYLSIVAPGKGTRATTYAPAWGFSPSEPPQRTTTSEPSERTNPVLHSGPLRPAVNLPSGSHIHLPQPPTGALTVGVSSSEVGCASAPSAPPRTDPDGPAGVDTLAILFDDLWDVYGVRQKRDLAKAALRELSPGADAFAKILAAAGAWRRHYDETGTSRQYQRQLHTWLKKESYLEDPPLRREVPVARAKTKSDDPATPVLVPTPPTPMLCRIISTSVENKAGEETVAVRLARDDGTEFSRSFKIQADNPWEQHVDNLRFAKLALAAGLGEIKDSDELVGATVIAIGDMFVPAAANDNATGAVTPVSESYA